MDSVYVKRFNAVIEELQFNCHSTMYIRKRTNKRYEKITFVFNLYQFPDGLWKPLYLCYVNDIKQQGYTDSSWYQSNKVYEAYQNRVADCESEYCWCKPKEHHSFEIHPDKTKRYFELVLDIGNITDGKGPKPNKIRTIDELKRVLDDC